MRSSEYLTHTRMQASVVPERAAYLIAHGSAEGFRRAVQIASNRWGGLTEPIIPVPATGPLDDAITRVVAASGVDLFVNIDLDPAIAEQVASALGMTVLPLDDIHQMATCTPLAVTGFIRRSNHPVVANPDSPLWQVAAAGYLGQLSGQDAAAFQVRPTDRGDDIWRSQLGGQTRARETVACLEMLSRIGEEHPAVLWITGPDDVDECASFWNARALQPLDSAPAVLMTLVPSDDITYWIGAPDHVRLLRNDELRPGQADIAIVGGSVSSQRLTEIAEYLGLEPHHPDGGRRSLGGSGALTYRTDLDPLSWLLADHHFGVPSLPFDVQVAGGAGEARFASPVRFHRLGRTLVRLSGSALQSLPKRPQAARLVSPIAIWHRNSLELPLPLADRYDVPLRFPSLQDAIEALLDAATRRHTLSSAGRLGSALEGKADIAHLLQPGVYEAATDLTTPRSKALLKKLEELREEGEGDAELIELATTWGGRAERRTRAPDDLSMPTAQAAEALERLCAMSWAERGLRTECQRCGLSAFRPMAETVGLARCPGCGAPTPYDIHGGRLSVVYRLDSFVDRASDSGLLPHLLVIAALRHAEPQAAFLPGTDVTFSDGSMEEVDIFGVWGGKVLAGEIKTSAGAFTAEQLTRDVALSTRLQADIHLLATPDTVPDAVRSAAQQLCDDAGLQLLVYDRTMLRPGAEPVRSVTAQDGLTWFREAAQGLLTHLETGRPMSEGRAAGLLKKAAGGVAAPSAGQIKALVAAAGRYADELPQYLQALIDGTDELLASMKGEGR